MKNWIMGVMAAAAIGALFFVFGCGPGQPESNVYRLLDHLDPGGITAFPEKAADQMLFPEKSNPLTDMGSGENPDNLKRKLKIGGRELDVLMAPPGSKFEFTPKVKNPGVMDFGIGMVKENDDASPDSGLSCGITFRIILEREGRQKTIFQKFAEIPEGEDHVYILDKIEIPYDLSSLHLILAADGENKEGLFPFWFNPVVYPPESNGRKIIFISIDTLRADHLQCYGYGRDTSPHIDALAEDGVLFEKTLAAAPWTLPSHVSMFTSLYGAHHQVYREDQRMDPELITLAERLRSRGFHCAAFTGGGFLSSGYGFSKGFSSYQEGEGGVFHQDSAHRMFGAVSAWLDRNRDRDFFLFIHTYQPHSPYACPPPYKVMFLEEDAQFGHVDLLGHLGGKSSIFRPLPDAERRNIIALYDGEIRYTDERLIGPLVDKLKQMGIYDDAFIVLTSDHGEEFYEHGGWGHGQSLYNESLRVPLIFKFPDSRNQGTRIPDWVSLVDIMPTVLYEAGIEYPHKKMDGIKLQDYLGGDHSVSRRLLADVGADILGFHLPRQIAAVQTADKVIFRGRMDEENLDFFSIPPAYAGLVEMYRLPRDPDESNNIADQYPSLVNGLIEQVNDFYRSAVKHRPGKAAVDEQVKEQLKALGYIR